MIPKNVSTDKTQGEHLLSRTINIYDADRDNYNLRSRRKR